MVTASPDDLLKLLPDDEATAMALAAHALVQDIAEQLRTLRRGSGLNQKQLAERLGVSQGRISQIESGLMDHAPNLEMVARYATVCGAKARLSVEPTAADQEAGFHQLEDSLVTAGVAGTVAVIGLGGQGSVIAGMAAAEAPASLVLFGPGDVVEAGDADAGNLLLLDDLEDVIEAHPAPPQLKESN